MKITRRDSVSFLLGGAIVGATSAGLRRFKEPPDWKNITPKAPQFPIRDSARGFIHQGKMWVAGGYMTGTVPYFDIYSSEDGAHWTLINDKAPFGRFAPITSHNGKIVATWPNLMASEDGKRWEDISTTGPSPGQASEKPIVSYKGKLFVLNDDKTYALTGTEWKAVDTPFVNRMAFVATVHNDLLYVVAGAALRGTPDKTDGYPDYRGLNEVWVSSDPEDYSSWVQLTGDAEWRPRMWPAFVSLDGWLYVANGYVNDLDENIGDTWRSRDGRYWERYPTKTVVPARHAPTAYAYNGRFIMIAGNTNKGVAVQNDMWALKV